MTSVTSRTDCSEDEPVYWFVLWESAIERGDFEEATDAAMQLRRLGILVSSTNPAKESEVAHVP